MILGTPFEARQQSLARAPEGPNSLPGRAYAAPPAGSPGNREHPASTSEQRALPRIFVVDDEEFIRDLYRDVFESSGMTVFSAQSGDEAVTLFKSMKHKPDVIIMDHRMPGKDGIETTREILKLDPTVPIVFSSADETVRDEALAAGAVSFWTKPFPMTMLVSAMRDLFEERRKRSSEHFH